MATETGDIYFRSSVSLLYPDPIVDYMLNEREEYMGRLGIEKVVLGGSPSNKGYIYFYVKSEYKSRIEEIKGEVEKLIEGCADCNAMAHIFQESA